MKKLIVLFSGIVIAASAAAQADRAGSSSAQPAKSGSVDRQAPVTGGSDRENRAKEPPESANVVDPDFQGSSKQQTTASGMGQPKHDTRQDSRQDSERSSGVSSTGSAVLDAEDKTKK